MQYVKLCIDLWLKINGSNILIIVLHSSLLLFMMIRENSQYTISYMILKI